MNISCSRHRSSLILAVLSGLRLWEAVSEIRMTQRRAPHQYAVHLFSDEFLNLPALCLPDKVQLSTSIREA
jgi:hypothetical protein